MREVKYRVESEDIDFPSVNYTNDIKFKDKTSNSYLNRIKRYIKLNLKCVLILLSVIIVLIVAIILISVFSTKKDKVIDEEWNGGFLTIKLSKINQNEEKVTVFNYEQMDLSDNDFIVNTTEKNLRVLNEGKAPKKIFEFKNDDNRQDISFNIKFKKPIKSMYEMFKDNIYLDSINLSNLITREIENLNSAFENCVNLINVDFGNFDNNKIESLDNTFENCLSIKEIDLSSFNLPKLNSMVNTFKNCKSLESLRMDNFEIDSNINISGIFDSNI